MRIMHANIVLRITRLALVSSRDGEYRGEYTIYAQLNGIKEIGGEEIIGVRKEIVS